MATTQTLGTRINTAFRLHRFVRHDHLVLTLTGVSLLWLTAFAYTYSQYEGMIAPVLREGIVLYGFIIAWILRTVGGTFFKAYGLVRTFNVVTDDIHAYKVKHSRSMSIQKRRDICQTLFDDFLRTENMYAGHLLLLGIVGTAIGVFYGLVSSAGGDNEVMKQALTHGIAIGFLSVALTSVAYIWVTSLINLVQSRIDFLVQEVVLDARTD